MSTTRAKRPPAGLRALAIAAQESGVEGPLQVVAETVSADVVQAQVEGVKLSETVEFAGQEFRVAPKVGLMPLLKFAHSASQGLTADDMAGMAAMYAMIRDCIHQGTEPCGECSKCTSPPQRCPMGGRCGFCNADPPAFERCPGFDKTACQYFDAGDWQRFENAAIDSHADGDDLFDVINRVMEIVSARPTQPPDASSRSERKSSARSKASSSRRPDLPADLRPVGEIAASLIS